MSQNETEHPVTELVVRAWKLLTRFGVKRTTPNYDRYLRFRTGDYFLHSHNRHLWFNKQVDGQPHLPILEVTEEGMLNEIDALECAYALEYLRKEMVLDDLVDVGEVEEA